MVKIGEGGVEDTEVLNNLRETSIYKDHLKVLSHQLNIFILKLSHIEENHNYSI